MNFTINCKLIQLIIFFKYIKNLILTSANMRVNIKGGYMSSIQSGNPQDPSKTPTTEQTTATTSAQPTTVPQTPDVVTLSALMGYVSSATEGEQTPQDEQTPSGDNVGDGGAETTVEDLSADHQVGQLQKGDQDGGTGSERERGTLGEDAVKIHRDLTTAPKRTLEPMQTLNMSGEANVDSTIERANEKHASEQTISASKAIGGSSVFSSSAPQSVSQLMKDLSTETPQFCSSIGLSAETVSQVSQHFQNASVLADRLANPSEDLPPQVTQRLGQAIQSEAKAGIQSMVHGMIQNPTTLENALTLQGLSPSLSAVLTKNIVDFVTTRNTTTQGQTSATSNPLNSSASITAMESAVANFITKVGFDTALESQYETDVAEANSTIGNDNVQAANITNTNTISDVKKQESQEAKEQRQERRNDKLMGGLMALGGFITIIAAAPMLLVPGAGEAAFAVVVACATPMIAQGIEETQGKSINPTEVIAKGMSEAFGGKTSSWDTALQVVGTVAGAVAGAAGGGPIMALMMFSMMAEQTGLSDHVTQTIVMAAGGNQNQINDAEMGVNIGLSIIPLAAGGAESLVQTMRSAEVVADEAATTAADAVVDANEALDNANSALKLATASGSAEDIEKATAAVKAAEDAVKAAENANKNAILAQQAAAVASNAKAGGDSATASQSSQAAKQSAAQSVTYSEQSTAAATKSAKLSSQVQASVASSASSSASAGTTSTTAAATAAKSSTATAGVSAVGATSATAGSAEETASLSQNVLQAISDTSKWVTNSLAYAGKTLAGMFSRSSNEFSSTVMGADKAQIVKACSAIGVVGGAVGEVGTVVSSVIEIELAKALISIADLQGEIDQLTATEDMMQTIMQSTNAFTSQAYTSENSMMTGLNQGSANVAQSSAGNFSDIWV